MVEDIGHRDRQMTFLVNTFPVDNEQDLRGFVFYPKGFRDFVGDGAIADEVEVVKIDGFRLPVSFEPVLDQGACGAARTVLEYELGAAGGPFADLVQLFFFLQGNPIHGCRL